MNNTEELKKVASAMRTTKTSIKKVNRVLTFLSLSSMMLTVLVVLGFITGILFISPKIEGRLKALISCNHKSSARMTKYKSECFDEYLFLIDRKMILKGLIIMEGYPHNN